MAQSTSIYADAASFEYGQYEVKMESTPQNPGFQTYYEREEHGDLFPTSPTLFEDGCIDPRLLIKDQSALSVHPTGDATLQSMTEERHHIDHFEDPYRTASHETIASASSSEANDAHSESATRSCFGSASGDIALPESG
jgi:hypothetical protein